jgi:hypothetical protein
MYTGEWQNKVTCPWDVPSAGRCRHSMPMSIIGGDGDGRDGGGEPSSARSKVKRDHRQPHPFPDVSPSDRACGDAARKRITRLPGEWLPAATGLSGGGTRWPARALGWLLTSAPRYVETPWGGCWLRHLMSHVGRFPAPKATVTMAVLGAPIRRGEQDEEAKATNRTTFTGPSPKEGQHGSGVAPYHN